MSQREFPAQAAQLLAAWWRAHWRWGAVHYTLGLIAAVGAVLAATETIPFEAATQAYVGVVAAVCTAIITFAKTGAKMNAYIAAWRILNVVRVRYEIDASISAQEVGDTISKCEEIIGRAD